MMFSNPHSPLLFARFILFTFGFFWLHVSQIEVVWASLPIGFYPNVVIFFADDLGYGDLSCYGHPISLTPNLDSLAHGGTRFTDFYSSSPVCSPSRAALLTGRFQTRSGIWPSVFFASSSGGLPLTEITIAKLLKSINSTSTKYSTGLVGKWHLGIGGKGGQNGTYLPLNHGFDYYTGIPYASDNPDPPYCFPYGHGCWSQTWPDPWNATITDSFGFDDVDGDDINGDTDTNNDISNMISVDSDGKSKYAQNITQLPLYLQNAVVQQPINMTNLPDYYTSYAKYFINNAVNQLKQPFFLYMAYHETHHPQYASLRYFNKTQRGMFGDALSEMDYNIGSIVEYIDSLGIRNETLIIFTSDNGPAFMRLERGGNAGLLKCGKGTTYEGGQRVPGIINMPGFIESNRITRGIASTLDIFPTIAELIDVPLPTDRSYDGYSLVSWLFKNTDTDHGIDKSNEIESPRKIFYYWPESVSIDNAQQNNWWTQSLHAVRYNQWKLHWIVAGSHCPNTFADSDCRDNNTEHMLNTPILFNLYHDAGERYPLNILWPNETLYQNIIQQVNATIEPMLNSSDLWGQSQINKGGGYQWMPCGNYGCVNWPDCCNVGQNIVLSDLAKQFWQNQTFRAG